MSATRADFALLLAAPDPTEADLAKDLLASAGIPCMLHGQDRDLAELGAASHAGIARPDLLVPKAALARAREVLRDSWDPAALTDEVALAFSAPAQAVTRSRVPSWPWFLLVLVLGLAFYIGARSL